MKKLLTICLVLLLCAPALATKVGRSNLATAVASVQTDTDALEILSSDVLALAALSGGNVWYVDKDATGSGTAADWTNADITIELAQVHAAANNGDYIVCAPYHAETASAGTFDLAKDGITLIGLGKGDAMTTITYDGTTDTVIMGAGGDGCTIRNIKFIATVTAVAIAIVVEDGCTDYIIEDCVFKNESTGTDEFIDTIYIHGTAANNGIIRRNRFEGDIGANSGPQSSIGFEDAHFLQIYDNEFSGDIAVAHIENKTTAANFITIRDNRILCGYIGDAASTLDTTPGITLFATTTGWIQDNFVVTNVATPDLAIVAADCYLSGNTYTELQGTANTAVSIGYIPGQTYVVSMTSTLVTDDMFTVAGGPILITSLVGEITTVSQTQANTVEIGLVATNTFNHDFTTGVEVTGDLDGDRYVFDATATESVLTPCTGADGGSAGTMTHWYCSPGVITLTATASPHTGNVLWYMTFIPLAQGVTVTPM